MVCELNLCFDWACAPLCDACFKARWWRLGSRRLHSPTLEPGVPKVVCCHYANVPYLGFLLPGPVSDAAVYRRPFSHKRNLNASFNNANALSIPIWFSWFFSRALSSRVSTSLALHSFLVYLSSLGAVDRHHKMKLYENFPFFYIFRSKSRLSKPSGVREN